MKTQAITRPHGGKHYRASAAPKKHCYTPDALRARQGWPLVEKIDWAHEKIQHALSLTKKPSCAFSAGKDRIDAWQHQTAPEPNPE